MALPRAEMAAPAAEPAVPVTAPTAPVAALVAAPRAPPAASVADSTTPLPASVAAPRPPVAEWPSDPGPGVPPGIAGIPIGIGNDGRLNRWTAAGWPEPPGGRAVSPAGFSTQVIVPRRVIPPSAGESAVPAARRRWTGDPGMPAGA